MAVEEAEYYSLHQGNGVSGGVRDSPAPRSKKKPKPAAASTRRSSSGMTSFLQGITLGTVLLIPVGVWCWVKVNESTPPVETQETQTKAKTAKGKPAPPVAPKRKPMRATNTGPALLRGADAGAVKAKALVETDQPPAIPVPVPTAPAPVASQIPRVNNESFEEPKEKKSIWRTLSSPFRGKTKPPNPPQPDVDNN